MVETGAKYVTEPSALLYQCEFGAFLLALKRCGFIRAGHEVGPVSVVLDNFRIPDLDTLLTEDALGKFSILLKPCNGRGKKKYLGKPSNEKNGNSFFFYQTGGGGRYPKTKLFLFFSQNLFIALT